MPRSLLLLPLIVLLPAPPPLHAAPPANYQLPVDWLIDGSSYPAKVEKSSDGGSVILENGLVRRVIRVRDGCATVALDDLMGGRSLLRSPRAEAEITLDGKAVRVGGLVGQPNHAYLDPEWLADMGPDPDAMKLVGFSTGKTKERFAWKRTRHHAPDAVWPPPGVSLRLDFEPVASSVARTNRPSEFGRKILWEDGFAKPDPSWKISASKHDERVSFRNEGKAGEIYAPSATHVFADRELPPETALVEATFSFGTDRGVSWGPGLGLVFASGHVIKVNARPGDRGEHGHFERRDGRDEALASLPGLAAADGGLDPARVVRLRAVIEPRRVLWEAAEANANDPVWHPLFETPREESWGRPVAARVGKMDRSGGATDDAAHGPGEWGRMHVQRVLVCGPFDESTILPEGGKPPFAVSVHYELYDGVPIFRKWIEVHNRGEQPVSVDRFTAERLAVVEAGNQVESPDGVALPVPDALHVETDQAFGGFSSDQANRHAVRWTTDPLFHTQVNYQKRMPCLLEVSPFRGPAQIVAPGGSFTTFNVFLLVHDSSEKERRGLAQRKFYRVLAPWATENPIMHHMRSANPAEVLRAIDQAAEVGFEMIILSFGSGFNAENDDPAYLESWRKIAETARAKNIDLGSYSLLASRSVGGGNDVVSPPGERPTFGNAPALTSDWGTEYFRKLYQLHEKTGFRVFEHDGSYPGDWDTTSRPPRQRGLEDSQWAQWMIIRDFYVWCRGQSVYLNVPDFYFLAGSNKCGMGYREVNWSLPRAQQVIHTRQNIYDGTWDRAPSMGWMFVPLTEYQGGGAAATIEPLDQHLDHYRLMMRSNFAFGVQACYRGPRLFDTDRTRDMVKAEVAWFKRHRDILESDVIHLRRADGRDWDGMLHVNPKLEQRALLAVFNPLPKAIEREIVVPLYYAGLKDSAAVSVDEGAPSVVRLDGHQRTRIRLTIQAMGFRSVVFTPTVAR